MVIYSNNILNLILIDHQKKIRGSKIRDNLKDVQNQIRHYDNLMTPVNKGLKAMLEII